MRILISGVSGYAGFYAAIRLAAAGHQVTGLARNPDSARLDILRAHEVAVVKGDIAVPDSYRDLLDQSQVMVHTILDKKAARETDRALFAAYASLSDHPGTRRRLIYTTGCSIFGDAGPGVRDELTEAGEGAIFAFRRELEIEAMQLPNVGTVVVRPCFIYGNDGFNSQTGDWFAMAAEDDAVYRGNREKYWSWVHVDDLAEAYQRVTEFNRSIDGEVFCITDGSRTKCLDVMQGALKAAGYTGEIRFEGPMRGDSASTHFDRDEVSSSAKAQRVLGWRPRHANVIESLPAAYGAWKAAQNLVKAAS